MWKKNIREFDILENVSFKLYKIVSTFCALELVLLDVKVEIYKTTDIHVGIVFDKKESR